MGQTLPKAQTVQIRQKTNDRYRALQEASKTTSAAASGLSTLEPLLCQAIARASFKEKLKQQRAPFPKTSPASILEGREEVRGSG